MRVTSFEDVSGWQLEALRSRHSLRVAGVKNRRIRLQFLPGAASEDPDNE
jgi:hypothetical protein